MLEDGGSAGTSHRRPVFDTPLKIPNLANVSLKVRVEALEVSERELVELTPALLGQLDRGTRNVVSLPERHPAPDQVLGEVGGKHVVAEPGPHAGAVGSEGRDDPSGDLKRADQGVHGVKEGLLVLLKVFVVGARETLEGHEEASALAKGATRLASEELQTVRVLLLGHEAAPRAVGVREGDEAKLGRRVDDEVLGNAAEVAHGQGGPEEELGDEVPVRDPNQGVGNHPRKPELVRQEITVNSKGVSREGATPKWQLVNPVNHLGKPVSVGLPHPRVEEEKVRPADGLRPLEVSVPRDEEINLPLGAISTGSHQLTKMTQDPGSLLTQPQPGIRRHLVIAAASRMELPRRTPNQLRQPPLIGSMDILISSTDLEPAFFPLRACKTTTRDCSSIPKPPNSRAAVSFQGSGVRGLGGQGGGGRGV